MSYDAVLYISNECDTCKFLVESLPNGWENQIFIQDVESLEQLPDWLDGVPLMVQTNDGSVTRGSRDILARIGRLD